MTVTLTDLAGGAAALRVEADGLPTCPLVLVDLSGEDWSRADLVSAAGRGLAGRTVVTVGVTDRPLPAAASPLIERLTCTLAPGGPGRAWVRSPDPEAAVAAIREHVGAAPRAALTLAGLLPATARASTPDGLLLESLAYSLLLAGPEHAGWRSRTPRRPVPAADRPVLAERSGDVLEITLNRPERRNAFGRAMRDGLIDALEVAACDPTVREVVVSGNGPSFCSGGDLDEFGTAPDAATAHLVRLDRSAGWAFHQVRRRTRVVVHGACVGAGVEVPSFAGRVDAKADAWFMLPELSMGLVPGAGGTVSIPQRIGQWRTAFMVLTGQAVELPTALAWGLVDGRC